MAAYRAPVSEVEKKILDCNYPLLVKKKCEGVCVEIKKEFNCKYYEIAEEMVDDSTKPVHSKSESEVCADQLDCETKNESKICADVLESVFMAEDFSEIYCSKFIRFEQKLSGRKTTKENSTKKAAYDSTKASSDAMEAGIAQALKRIDHGKRIIALLLVRNAPKTLNKGQIKQMNATYAEIKGLLDTGSLETAKDEITAITPDGTIVTEADKTALISEINKFLGL